MTFADDPYAALRTPGYVKLLAFAAAIGAPIAAAAYGFLWLVDELQDQLYGELPRHLGYQAAPMWWPAPLLALSGLLVGCAIRYLPGRGGESPADGFTAGGGPPPAIELPGIFLAALAGLCLGAVIGPEAPLIVLGGGLAAISTLLGSPLVAAFLLMEASGLGGPVMALVLVPGLVAAGIGSLIFTLVLLVVCKGLAYAAALSSFRGGPIFPAMFVGAVGGIALAHLPGLDPTAGAAMGIGAMTVTMLRLPLTSVLLATLLLFSTGIEVLPLAIIAVAVAYVASERLRPTPTVADGPEEDAARFGAHPYSDTALATRSGAARNL